MHLLVDGCFFALPIGVKVPRTIPHARKFAYCIVNRYLDHGFMYESVTKFKIDGRQELPETVSKIERHFGMKMLWVVMGYCEAGWFVNRNLDGRMSEAKLIAVEHLHGDFAVLLGETNGALFEAIVEFDS